MQGCLDDWLVTYRSEFIVILSIYITQLKAEMESIQKAETKKLIQELFVAEKRVTESEGKVKDLQTEIRILKENQQLVQQLVQ